MVVLGRALVSRSVFLTFFSYWKLLLLIVCLVVCVLFSVRLTKKNRSIQPGGKIAHDDLLAFFKASRMVLDFDEIELKSVIGSGAFATVFRGIYRYRIGRPGEAGGDKKIVRSFVRSLVSIAAVFVGLVCVCRLCVSRARLSFLKMEKPHAF